MLEQMFLTFMEGAVCVGAPYIFHLCKNMFSSWIIELDLSFWRSANVTKVSQEDRAKGMVKTDQEFRTNLFSCLEVQRRNSLSAIHFQRYCHLLSTHPSTIAEQMWCGQSYLSIGNQANSTHISLERTENSQPVSMCTSTYSELNDLYLHFTTATSFSATAEENLQCDLTNISHNLQKDTSGYLTSNYTEPEGDSRVPLRVRISDKTQCDINELNMSIRDCVYNQDGQLVQMFVCFDIEHSDSSSAVSSSDSGCKNCDSDCEDFIVFENSYAEEDHCCARFDFVCSETKPHQETFVKSVVLSSNLYCGVSVIESFNDKLDLFVQEMLQPNLCYSCEELILNKKCTKEVETNRTGDFFPRSSTVKTASQDRKKKVHFKPDNELAVVHPMIVWSFAYKQARKGTWEVDALDRLRFQKRIEEVNKILTPVLLAKIKDINLHIK